MPVLWSHLSTADDLLDRLSCSTSLRSLRVDRWAFRLLELVGAFNLVNRRAIRLMPAGLVGSVECGQSEWRCHWPYWLLSWRSSRLVWQFLFRQLQRGIRRRLHIMFPVGFFEVDVGSPRSINRGQFWSWLWWGWADDHWQVRWRLTSLIVVRCHWRPNLCRAKLTSHLSVAA